MITEGWLGSEPGRLDGPAGTTNVFMWVAGHLKIRMRLEKTIDLVLKVCCW